jgi:hypothetical protein
MLPAVSPMIWEAQLEHEYLLQCTRNFVVVQLWYLLYDYTTSHELYLETGECTTSREMRLASHE